MYNQYTIISAVAKFIRENPNSPLINELKACRSQDQLIKVFEKGTKNGK